ncbi:MAG: VWA domain-containing protein [Deltaproteobacteria bacterium]|nr:VWA domain-containing protein [Deltaproteobacteria bacterium]
MWGRAGATTKIEAARTVMSQIVPGLPPEVKVGLVAYGHRRKGDCGDIEVLISSGSDDRATLVAKVQALQPKGKTPISAAVSVVVEQLKTKETETTIVLISDGLETCAADPCRVVKDLKQTGIKFVMHVVGFGIPEEDTKQLRCLAAAGGGTYLVAADLESLREALHKVTQGIEKMVAVEKAKSVQVKAKTGLGKIILSMPESTRKGMAGLRIIRVADGKLVKETERLQALTTHPLLSGEYAIEYLFAAPNYGDPTVTHLGKVTLAGGENQELKLGGVVFNIADRLQKDACVEHVIIAESGSGKAVVTVNDNQNGYYNFVSKAVMPGIYDILIHYSHSPEPTEVAGGVVVKPGQETVVTLDSGISLKAVTGTDITGWDLIPLGAETISDQTEDDGAFAAASPCLQARPPSGNKSTLWAPYLVPPGKYRLLIHVAGMSEPLPVAEALTIEKGQTLVFDSGL